MPLSHQWAHLAWPGQFCSVEGSLLGNSVDILPPQKPAQHLLAWWNPASKGSANWISRCPATECVLSSAIGPFHLSYSRQPTEREVVYVVSRDFGGPLWSIIRKEVSHIWHWAFHLIIHKHSKLQGNIWENGNFSCQLDCVKEAHRWACWWCRFQIGLTKEARLTLNAGNIIPGTRVLDWSKKQKRRRTVSLCLFPVSGYCVSFAMMDSRLEPRARINLSSFRLVLVRCLVTLSGKIIRNTQFKVTLLNPKEFERLLI